ncbi:MAG: hypothetical protein M3Q92_04125, partial [Actinomycetota bacterium]|nr:hypothetical protein [Actinomycetota bacterium]
MRRLWLVAGLAAATLFAASAAVAIPAARCAATLNDGAGPFTRGAPPIRTRIGTGHVLSGVVLSTDCKPLGRA